MSQLRNPPPLTPRGAMLWRSLQNRSNRPPAFLVVFGLLIVALASRGSSGGVAFSLLLIFGPLLALRAVGQGIRNLFGSR